MDQAATVKALLITLAVLAGVIVGLVAGLVTWVGGSSLSISIRHGGVAFGGAVTLIILIFTAAGLL